MTNADWVFSRAIHLMDEQNETTGATLTSDTQEYRLRTLSILNVLRGELFPYSDTYGDVDVEAGRRPVCPMILNFDDPICLDDVICQTVMPYGLAAHLLLGENDTLASFFNQRYEEELANAIRTKRTDWESIKPYYGF